MSSQSNDKKNVNPQKGSHNPQNQKSKQMGALKTDRMSNINIHISKNQDINSFKALKKLKETEQHIKRMRGRFKVLRFKQQSSRAKTIHHQKLIKFNQEIEKNQSLLRAQIQRASLQREKQANEQKQKNLKLKEQIKKKNKKVKQNMFQQKIEENKKLKQQSIYNQKKFKEMKAEDISQKIKRRMLIANQQRQRKQKVDRYKQEKSSSVRHYKTLQTNQIIQINSTKQKQLQQLMRIQVDLAKQNQNSLQASRALKIKLQSVITRRNNRYNENNQTISFVTNQSTPKLPQIKRRSISTNEQLKTIT